MERPYLSVIHEKPLKREFQGLFAFAVECLAWLCFEAVRMQLRIYPYQLLVRCSRLSEFQNRLTAKRAVLN